jgi:hypothetical protein
MQSYVESIKNDVARFQSYSGAASLGRRNYSVTNVAMVVIEWVENGHPLPASVDTIVEGAYVPDWFAPWFYATALAEMVHKGWLRLEGDQIHATASYNEAVNYARGIRESVNASCAAQDRRSQIYQEGRTRSLQSLPACVQAVLERGDGASLSYNLANGGISINASNFTKRVLPGVEVVIEFGKRHFSWDSTVSGRRETSGGTYYVRGKIVEPGRGRQSMTTVEVDGETLSVESYRISRVI